MSRVYFIKPVGMEGPIKIGCSVSPDNRRKTLENWAPFALEVIAEIEGDFALERRFHALFEAEHQRREWFTASPTLLEVVSLIQRGHFDVSTLPEPKTLTANLAARSAAHKRLWTPERRMVASYCHRVINTQKRTRTMAPVFWTLVRDPIDRAKLDAYLADPHRHGEPVEAYIARTGFTPRWAKKVAGTERSARS